MRDLALIHNEARSLAERYRPRRFGEVVGQDAAAGFLCEQARRRIGRGVLLHGPTGCGKTSLAEIYARALLCQKGDGDPCLDEIACRDCKAFARGQHPGWRFFRDGAVDEGDFVREINRDVDSEVLGGGWLTILIDQAEGLSRPAFDALRARLERPPRKVTFILCTDAREAIPAKVETLLKPLEVGFASMPTRLVLLRRLCEEELVKPDEGTLERIAGRAGGSLRACVRDLEAVAGEERTITDERVRAYYGLHQVGPVERFLKALLSDGGLDAQLAALLDDWDLPSECKIETIEAVLGGLLRRDVLRQAAGSTVVDDWDWKSREWLVTGLTERGERRGWLPRPFWQALVRVWAPLPAATEASLLVKACECDEWVNGPNERRSALAELHLRRRNRKARAGKAPVEHASGASDGAQEADERTGAGSVSAEHLTKRQVRSLWEAASFLVQRYGLCLNTRLTLRWRALGIEDPRAVGSFLSELTNELRMLVNGRAREEAGPEPFHWLYVHVSHTEQGLRTDLVAHIPESAGDVAKWLREQFLPRQLKAACPPEAFVWRRRAVLHDRGFAHHLFLLRLVCRGLDPGCRVTFVDDHGKREDRSLVEVLRVDRRLRGPIGPWQGAQRRGVSELINRGAQDASGLDLPALSAFARKAWGHVAGEWELNEHGYRSAIMAERTELERKIRTEWPGDDEQLEAFHRDWGREASARAARRPGWARPLNG